MNRVSWTWRHAFARSELSSTTKLVLHTIGLHMDETGHGAYPTVAQIMRLSSLSNKAVITHIRIAIQQGWLRSKVHGFKGQKWKNHEYEAHWPDENGAYEGGEPQSNLTDKLVNVSPKGGERQSEKVVNEVHSKVPIQHSNNITPLSPPKGKAHLLPDDWTPSEAGRDLAVSLGVDWVSELEVFRDYWISVPDAKGRKKNWDATWRNWVRRSKPSNKKSNSQTMVEAFARA